VEADIARTPSLPDAQPYAASAADYADHAKRTISESSEYLASQAQSAFQMTADQMRDQPLLVAAVGLAAGAVIGFCNGFIIAKIGINPFVTTLAMMSMVRGMLLVITRGRNISGLPESFRMIGQGNVHGVQNPIWIALLMVLVGDILLRKSRFFRQNYYLGGNERAAMLSGIRIDRLKIFNYSLTGLLAAFAGIIMTARLGAASVTAGTGLELKVISAVIIGGASLKGGEGTILGSFLGSLLMGILVGALTILGVDVYWNTFVIGATLLLAVLIDTFGRSRRKLP